MPCLTSGSLQDTRPICQCQELKSMWQAAGEAEKRSGSPLPWQNPVKSWDLGSRDGAPFRQERSPSKWEWQIVLMLKMFAAPPWGTAPWRRVSHPLSVDARNGCMTCFVDQVRPEALRTSLCLSCFICLCHRLNVPRRGCPISLGPGQHSVELRPTHNGYKYKRKIELFIIIVSRWGSFVTTA